MLWQQRSASETYTSASTPIQYAAISAYEKNAIIEEQLKHSRRILQALGLHLYERFKALQIHTPKPQGGFYLFPDFSHYKERFMAQGVLNSTDFLR